MSDENPYSSPIPVADRTKGLSFGRIAVIVLLIVLMIPATGVAFMTTCLSVGFGTVAIMEQIDATSDVLAWLAIGTAFLSGIVAAGAVAYGMIRAIRAVAIRPVSDATTTRESPPQT